MHVPFARLGTSKVGVVSCTGGELSMESVLPELRARFTADQFSPEARGKVSEPLPSSSDPFWTKTFHKLFVDSHQEGRDDILFFVKWDSKQGVETVEFMRKDSKSLPGPSDPTILWDQTLFLNLILHEFEYQVTCSVVTVKPGSDSLDDVKATTAQQVYPSPTRRRMDKKGKVSEVIYPNIMFCVDNFEEVFREIRVHQPGEKVAVQLLALNKSTSLRKMVFLGAVDYRPLKGEFDQKEQVPITERLKKMSVKRSSKVYSTNQTYRFIQMWGPGLKGFAEMAVRRHNGTAPSHTTPVELLSRTAKHSLQLHDTDKNSTASYDTPQKQETSDSDVDMPGVEFNEIDFLPGVPAGLHDVPVPVDRSPLLGSRSAERQEAGDVPGSSASRDSISLTDGVAGGLETIKNKLKYTLSTLKRKPESEGRPLQAYLTYIQLPWYTLVNDILNGTRKPVL